MVTIKDIAKMAGVSHGTVSNILNGKGNVSVEKIQLVEEIARKNGYSINAKAKMLRKGSTRSLAVILPDITNPHFASFFTSLKSYVEEHEYALQLYLTGDIPSREEAVVNLIATQRVDGVVVVTCIPHLISLYDSLTANGTKLMFIERRPEVKANFLGFDYRTAGAEIMKDLIERGLHRIGVITGLHIHSCEKDFYEGFMEKAREECEIIVDEVHIQSEKGMAFRAAFSFFKDEEVPEAIAASNLCLAEGVLSACAMGTLNESPQMVVLSPSSIASGEDRIERYGVNSQMLGHEAGKLLIESINGEFMEPVSRILPCEGSKYQNSASISLPKGKTLNVLMLESPSTSALMKLSPSFTRKTGIKVNFAVFPYNELYDVINQMGDTGFYDVMRLDMVWLQWFKRKCLMPLPKMYRNSAGIFDHMLGDIMNDFSMVKGVPYAVPFDLSVQMLFYRKDLFEDPKVKRMYYEMNHYELAVPSTFEEYNRVAEFFTRRVNQNSPVEFGTTLTLGTTSGVVCEYLPRLFGAGGSLFDKAGRPLLGNAEAVEALKNYKESMKYACPIPENSWWKASVDNFISGNAAMMIMFINHASDIINIEKSNVAGMIGHAQVPGNSPLLGGGSMGISSNSRNKDEALDFIEWACGEEMSIPFTLLGGISPCASVYKNYELLEMFPWLNSAVQSYSIGRRREMWENNGNIVEEYKFEHTLGISIKSALLGVISEEEAMLNAQRGIEELIHQYNE